MHQKQQNFFNSKHHKEKNIIREEVEKSISSIFHKALESGDISETTQEEFIEIIHILKEIIIIIPKEDYSCFIKKAEKISPDPNDILYFALALKLNCPIWSNDKKLKEQNKILIYSTKDIIDILQLQSFPDHKIQ